MKNIVGMTAVLAATSGLAMAFDFQASFTGQSNGVDVGRGGVTAGYMNLTYVGTPYQHGVGQFANASFQTFCIDVQTISTAAANNPYNWTVELIQDAPTPGTAYGPAVESAVHSIIAAAIGLGWINSDLSNNGASNEQIAAIQALIWNTLPAFSPVAPTANIAVDYGVLDAAATTTYLNSTVSGLRAITTQGQDMLYVVPLPPAAFAGLATLFGVAGVARLRRRTR